MALDLPISPDLDRIGVLIDHRSEEPSVEYKTWMDLSAPENKAKIAKHLCALANFGGGWLIFGIDDKTRAHAEPHPGELHSYSQDILNGIVARYLVPEFHCNVFVIPSPSNGKKYPVVRVPSHGSQPVCARADGPVHDKRPVGIARGCHYIRVPGPKSVTIDSPELWRQVIHRCVLAERDQLLGSIGRLFEAPTTVSVAPSLGEFADKISARWNELQKAGWLTDPKESRAIFAFQFVSEEGKEPPATTIAALRDGVRDASSIADTECHGLGVFDPNYGGLSSSRVILDGDTDGLEAEAIHKDGSYLFAPSLWRVLITGIGAEVRPFHEDTEWVRDAVNGRRSRKWGTDRLSPAFQAHRTYEFIVFVRNLARLFPGAHRVRLLVDYRGLRGRMLDDTRHLFPFVTEKRSVTEGRRTVVEANIESLVGNGASETTAQLLNPVFRLFDGSEISADFVRTALRNLG